MTDWTTALRTIAPQAKTDIINGLLACMPRVIELAELTTPRRQAHFLAQVAKESDGFMTTREYASGAAYEGRRDLGNTHPGDGRRYKGRGLIQVTGRANYDEMSEELGIDFLGQPELLERFPHAAYSAAIFWKKHGVNAPADRDDVAAVTRKVNGGENGLHDRMVYLGRAKAAIE